jgi:Neutral/alkaline non-lysosomal ceramidase, N-terminal
MRVDTPQSRVVAGFARADITPPVGIYHRMWGAATHDVATGVHRPLTATALSLAPLTGSDHQILLAFDHCLLDAAEIANLRAAVSAKLGIAPGTVQIALSHTHGAGWLSRSRSHLPGGDKIGPYFDSVAAICADIASTAKTNAKPATFLYGTAKCSLAAHRDFWDESSKQFVCGYHPDGPADDTVMLAKVVADSGEFLGSIVNYACHPTTLAWQNTLISPDYIGAMYDVIERETGAPCLFLQGASGDLGPREGYVGDTAVADRNGRELGYAALSGLESLPAAGTSFEYSGPVVSGATLGSWEHRPLSESELKRQGVWNCRSIVVELPYRIDLPTVAETKANLAKWEAEERATSDPIQNRDSHAMVEQMIRQLARLAAIPEGRSFPLAVELWRLGDAFWVFVPGELYQVFQTALRARFPNRAVIVSTITNGWQPGYIPPASTYGYGIYQEIIAAVAPGSLETLIEVVARELRAISTA